MGSDVSSLMGRCCGGADDGENERKMSGKMSGTEWKENHIHFIFKPPGCDVVDQILLFFHLAARRV